MAIRTAESGEGAVMSDDYKALLKQHRLCLDCKGDATNGVRCERCRALNCERTKARYWRMKRKAA